MNIRLQIGWANLLAAALIVVLGCSGEPSKPTARLQGTVTIGGKQIPADARATIRFAPTAIAQAQSVTAQIQNGRFDAVDAPLGNVKVTFRIEQPTGVEAPFAPGARPEMQYRSLVPTAKVDGQVINVTGDKSDLTFDL
jgi:hypothetical protein